MSSVVEVGLIPVKLEEKCILENYLSLYLHDLSEYTNDLKVCKDGRFQYKGLELYFKREELKPYFIYFNDEVIGFILLNTGRFVPQDIDYSIHEMFILRSYRGRGIAAKAITKLFSDHQGIYKIQQMERNLPAISFWKKFYKAEKINYHETVEALDNIRCYTQVFKI